MFKRGLGEYNSFTKIDDFYSWYSATVSDPLPKQLYKAIFKAYIERIMVEVIYNSFDFSMGHNLGSIHIREKDYRILLGEDGKVDKHELVPDWGKILKKWKKIYADIPPAEWKAIKDKPMAYIENDHSDGTIKQWFWDKVTCNIPHQTKYKFNATRTLDRLLAKVNKESNVTYYR